MQDNDTLSIRGLSAGAPKIYKHKAQKFTEKSNILHPNSQNPTPALPALYYIYLLIQLCYGP